MLVREQMPYFQFIHLCGRKAKYGYFLSAFPLVAYEMNFCWYYVKILLAPTISRVWKFLSLIFCRFFLPEGIFFEIKLVFRRNHVKVFFIPQNDRKNFHSKMGAFYPFGRPFPSQPTFRKRQNFGSRSAATLKVTLYGLIIVI